MSSGEVVFEGPKEDPSLKEPLIVGARDVAESMGWEWREHPVLGDSTDKVQRIFEEVWKAGKAYGGISVESELRVELRKATEELEEYKSEFSSAVDEYERLQRAEKEKDQLIVDMQNRHAQSVNQILEARQKLAKAIGFPEEYVFVPLA